MRGPTLIRDTLAYGPLRADDTEDKELFRVTFGRPVASEKAYRVCWGLWDEDAGLWRNMRGEAVQPRSEWMRFKDVTDTGRYQPVPQEQYTEARFTTLWHPVSEGL